MVYLVTGGINRGKTSKIVSIYNETKSGDGFITKKIFRQDVFTGYEIVRLSNGNKMPFICKIGYEPDGWDEIFRYDIFSFSEKAFYFAENIINDILYNKISPIFIDEIGPVELGGQGFCDIFKEFIAADGIKYATVREACIKDVVSKFKIPEYKIIYI